MSLCVLPLRRKFVLVTTYKCYDGIHTILNVDASRHGNFSDSYPLSLTLLESSNLRLSQLPLVVTRLVVNALWMPDDITSRVF